MTTDLSLAEKIVELHRSLRSSKVAHAFGGALALAYCTADPRATRDIDVNVFLRPEQVDDLIAGLPAQVHVTPKNRRQLERDGQSRLWWADTPVDVFLSNHSFHDHAEHNCRAVPFAELDDLPVLACADLAVLKAFFGRAKDAVDIASMVAVDAIKLEQLEADTVSLLGDGELRSDFFALVRRAVADIPT